MFNATDTHSGVLHPVTSSIKNIRTIRTFVRRQGRITHKQLHNYATLHDKYCIPYTNKILDYNSIFNNNNPVTVEIGFGMGQCTAIIAKNNPNINYLGIEVHKPGVASLLGLIQENSLNNLRIIEYDAIEVFNTMIACDSVNAIHIFFPDPWPKKRHHKRRMLQEPNTSLFATRLAHAGYIYFVTDWKEYADFALCELNNTQGLINKYDTFAPPQAFRPITHFEQKGIAQNRLITSLFFIKQ